MRNKHLLLVLAVCLTLRDTIAHSSHKHYKVKDDADIEFNGDNSGGSKKEEPLSLKAEMSVPQKTLAVDHNESENRGPNVVMRTTYGVYSKADIDNSYARIKEILIRSFLLAGKGVIGHGAGIFTAILAQLINKEKKPIWETLEPKIDRKLRKEFTRHKMDNLVVDFRLMILMMGKKNLSMDNLNYILSRKSAIFPQDHSTTTFTATYIALMRTYLFFVSSAYMNIMAQGKLDKCAFARELTGLRTDIINGAKHLYKMRYKELVGIKQFNGQGDLYGKSYVIFKDYLTNEEIETWIIDTKKDTFDRIKSITKDMIQPLIDDFNDLASPDTHNSNCQALLAEPITDEEGSFSYPLDCYGTLREGDYEGERCALPCATYKEDGSRLWCFDKRIFIEKKHGEENEGYGYIGTSKRQGTSYHDQWDDCVKPSFDECMPVAKTNRSRLSQDMIQFE